MNQIKDYNKTTFEDIKHTSENGEEFWYARDLMTALEYSKWRNFEKVVEKAKTACEASNNNINNHFADAGKTIQMPKGASKIIKDYKLTRYACYLIVQNSDPRKEVVVLGQTYFAYQTKNKS